MIILFHCPITPECELALRQEHRVEITYPHPQPFVGNLKLYLWSYSYSSEWYSLYDLTCAQKSGWRNLAEGIAPPLFSLRHRRDLLAATLSPWGFPYRQRNKWRIWNRVPWLSREWNFGYLLDSSWILLSQCSGFHIGASWIVSWSCRLQQTSSFWKVHSASRESFPSFIQSMWRSCRVYPSFQRCEVLSKWCRKFSGHLIKLCIVHVTSDSQFAQGLWNYWILDSWTLILQRGESTGQ